MKNVCKLSPKQRNYSNLMYCTQGQGLGSVGGWVGGQMGRPKPLKELQIIGRKQCLYGGQCFQWRDIVCVCPPLLAHATHIHLVMKGWLAK